MTLNAVLEKLEEHDYIIHDYTEFHDKHKEVGCLCGYDIETWTDAGINMIHFIDCRDYEDGVTAENVVDQLKQINAAFDVDDSIYNLMQSESARERFSYREIVEDLEAYEERLRETVCEIQGLCDR